MQTEMQGERQRMTTAEKKLKEGGRPDFGGEGGAPIKVFLAMPELFLAMSEVFLTMFGVFLATFGVFLAMFGMLLVMFGCFWHV